MILRRILLAIAVLALSLTAAPASAGPFDGCDAENATTFETGVVACRRIDASATLGGTTAFSYFVPAACTADARCPTLYLLHGFGGDYTTMLGTDQARSAWVKALTDGPPVDPHAVLDPWNYGTATWKDLSSPLDVVLVAPHGRTLPGGFGPPVPELDLFWADWNPRFANSASYEGPPPRFETFFVDRLIPDVEATLPVGSGPKWRAIDGVSLGGYGAYKTGLQHPDLFASIGSVSGSHNILIAPGPDPVQATPPFGITPPVPVPYTPLPAFGTQVPIDSLPGQAQGFSAAFYVFGDPSFDQAWFRGNQPRDLAMNGRAHDGATRSVRLRALNNDAIPRRQQDLGASYPVAQAFEALVLAMNLETELAFADQEVANDYAINPGLHSGVYWDPFIRERIEDHMSLLAPSGSPPPAATNFDFRSISKDFSIWGWRFQVERQTVEFLNIRFASCEGVTLQGTGIVTVTPPVACGAAPFSVDLGYDFPTDEQAGAGAAPVYGKTVRIAPLPAE
jgi:S-formylglutathione hydrolase FrmB